MSSYHLTDIAFIYNQCMRCSLHIQIIVHTTSVVCFQLRRNPIASQSDDDNEIATIRYTFAIFFPYRN
jgi:hypothetical protein